MFPSISGGGWYISCRPFWRFAVLGASKYDGSWTLRDLLLLRMKRTKAASKASKTTPPTTPPTIPPTGVPCEDLPGWEGEVELLEGEVELVEGEVVAGYIAESVKQHIQLTRR